MRRGAVWGFEGFKERGGTLQAVLELVAVGEKDVLSVGLEGVEFYWNITELFLRAAVELVDIS